MIWKEERSRITAVHMMGNLRGLLGIRIDKSPECTDKGVARSYEGGRRKD